VLQAANINVSKATANRIEFSFGREERIASWMYYRKDPQKKPLREQQQSQPSQEFMHAKILYWRA
jgi:hypothetical protein